jgi:hypothetical protein
MILSRKATLQPKSPTKPKLSERPHLALKGKYEFSHDQPESNFRVGDAVGVRFCQGREIRFLKPWFMRMS